MISEFVREQKKDIFRHLDRINIKEIYIGIYAQRSVYTDFCFKKFLNFLKFKSRILCIYNILYCICDKN